METEKKKLLFRVSAEDFKKIPGTPIAYWINNRILSVFCSCGLLKDYALARNGMKTGNNDVFLRTWWELTFQTIKTNCLNYHDAEKSKAKWFPYNKGGEFRKWFGNNDFVVNWENLGDRIFNHAKEDGRHVQDYPNDLKFIPTLSWSLITSFKPAFRYKSRNLSDIAGMSLFAERSKIILFLGLLNSKVSSSILEMLTSTVNFQAGDIARIPIADGINSNEHISVLVEESIRLSQADWDSFETSWDFQDNPLIVECRKDIWSRHSPLWVYYHSVRTQWAEQCEKMRELEMINNRTFIDAYGMQDELSSEVPWDEITLTCNPWYRYGKKINMNNTDVVQKSNSEFRVLHGVYSSFECTSIGITTDNPYLESSANYPYDPDLEKRLLADTVKELISYAVGCMFGRYSLDRPGLAFAGGVWDPSLDTTFPPDADNVIPILDEDWFADDIVGRFQVFLKGAFGEETIHENLAFVEAALGKDIRSYFTKDFYTDHVKMYQKRPIYWLFSSPTGAFSALVYLHRYRPDTVGTVLTYLRSHITKVNAHIQEQEEIIASTKASASMKSKAVRERLKMQHELQELEDYERDVLYPLSTERLEIGLDDGVKVNYPKFGKALRPVKGLDAKEE